MSIRGILIAGVSLLGCLEAPAQELAPGQADVVMECFFDRKPSKGCSLQCGSELDQANGGKRVNWNNVDRVEIFHKGDVGRADTRSMLFARFNTESASKKGVTASLYIGPAVFCLWTTENINFLSSQHEFRITKFGFN
jgi:hypothetical protein